MSDDESSDALGSGGDTVAEDEGEFEVECIYGAEAVLDKNNKRKGDKRKYPGWSYLVKWDGYDESYNTWEHQDQFSPETEDLLQRFWEAVGIDGDHQKYDFGYRVMAPQEWIDAEKRRYAATKEKTRLKKLRKEAKRAQRAQQASSSQQAQKKEIPAQASQKTVASRKANQGLPPPKAPPAQLKTSGKTRTTKSKSADTDSDSEEVAENLLSQPPKGKGRKKRAVPDVPTEDEEEALSEEEPAAGKPGLKRVRVSQVKAQSEVNPTQTAHDRRIALRAVEKERAREDARDSVQDRKNRNKLRVEQDSEEKKKLLHADRSLSPVTPKEKKTFAAPARLWNNAATKGPAAITSGETSVAGATTEKTTPADQGDVALKDLFGDSPPGSDTERTAQGNTATTVQATGNKTTGQKPWRENKIKFYDPAADKPAQASADANAPNPILAKQKILERLRNEASQAALENGTPGTGGDTAMEAIPTAQEELVDYDEGENPVPAAPAPASISGPNLEETPVTAPSIGAHPTLPSKAPVPPSTGTQSAPPEPDVVDLTKMSSDQPEMIDLMETDAEQDPDPDIVMLDVEEQTAPSKQNAVSTSGEYFATIWVAGEALTSVKLTQVSQLRKFAPKLTFLCRERRLEIVSYYSNATILSMLEQGKVLQTGLLLFQQNASDGSSSNLAFHNLLHWLEDLALVAGAYVEQSNEKKKRLLLLFHSSNLDVLRVCQVPPWKSKDGVIIAAVELPESADWSRNPSVIERSKSTNAPVAEQLCVPYTIEKLRFPRKVLESDLRGRPYCVVPSNTNDLFVQRDVQNLTAALEYFRASSRPLSEIIDQETFVFIHRRNLRDMSGHMSEIIRLRKYPRVFFYCFGLGDPELKESVNEDGPQLLSTRGGIITFTPQAVLEDPNGLQLLLHDMSKRQGWQYYIIPSVLAALHEFRNPGSENQTAAVISLTVATSKPEEERLVLTESIDRAMERVCSKEQTPPQEQIDDQLRDKLVYMWTVGQFELLEAEPTKLLEMCRVVAAGTNGALNLQAITADVFEDMLSMQRQPRLLETYRRFVVITSNEREGRDAYKGALDCCTVSDFRSTTRAEFVRDQELATVQTPPTAAMDIDSL